MLTKYVLPLGLDTTKVRTHASSPGAPCMTDKGRRGRLHCAHRNHYQAPPDRVEHAPGENVVYMHRNHATNKPEVQRISNGRLSEGDEPWTGQNLERSYAWSRFVLPELRILQHCYVEKI